jgi:hypothetical protein
MVVRYSPVSAERSGSTAVTDFGIAVAANNELMPVSDKPIEIVICLGSSCFARGNAQNLRTVKTYLEQRAVAVKLCTRGALCSANAPKDPILWLMVFSTIT